MKKVRILIEVNGEVKRFFLTICNDTELEKIVNVISKEIANHK